MEMRYREYFATLLKSQQAALVDRWIAVQQQQGMGPELHRGEKILRAQSTRFVALLQAALETDDRSRSGPAWADLFALLDQIGRRHAQEGATYVETGMFLAAFKRPLIETASADFADGKDDLVELLWELMLLMDELTLASSSVYIEERDEIIRRQRADLAELSTPVLQLWRDVIVMPLVGTLDSRRALSVMETLLEAIDQHEASVAILDITGVSTVDTQVAQNIFKTAAAARLMGTECIVSGIGPQIAQTIVELGIDFGELKTRSTLSGAIQAAFSVVGHRVIASKKNR